MLLDLASAPLTLRELGHDVIPVGQLVIDSLHPNVTLTDDIEKN